MAALYLLALGLGRLACRLFEDKLPEEAVEFAEGLRNAVAGLRKTMDDARQKAGAPKGEPLEKFTVKIPDVGWEFPIEQAFGVLETAAKWHEKVGRMHCGIHAWS